MSVKWWVKLRVIDFGAAICAIRAILVFLVVTQNASCQNIDKRGAIKDATKSYILPENKGSIDGILMREGEVTSYFVKDKAKYGPCVIFPGQKRFREFYSGKSLNVIVLGHHVSVDLKPEWWHEADFDGSKFREIVSDHKIDLAELAIWLNINMPFSQLYSIARNSDGEIKLTDFDDVERIYVVNDLKKIGDLEPIEYSEGVEWKSSGVGFESITVRKNVAVSLSTNKTLQRVQKIDSFLSNSQKMLLLGAQYRFEKNLARAIDSVYAQVMHEESVSGMNLLFDQRICYCDYYRNANCEQLCESRTGGVFAKEYLQDMLHVRYENDSLNLNTSVPYTDRNPCKIATYISRFLDDMTCSGAGSVPDRLCGIAGGNMMITDKLAFIGKNELIYLQKSQNRRNILRNGLSEQKQDIESCLLDLIYADAVGKKVVWVGTVDSVQQYSVSSVSAGFYSYQPVYHIDLFFHPLGDISGNREFFLLSSRAY